MADTVLLLGAFDVKGEEYAFVRELILSQGCDVVTMNFGVMGTTEAFPVDIEAAQVAAAGDDDLEQLRAEGDRGKAMTVMSIGAEKLILEMYNSGRFKGVFGMGGTGGSSVISRAMRALPVGVPKVLISTAASGDTTVLAGVKDVTMIPSVVDVAGINPISEKVFKEGAGAICGMVKMDYSQSAQSKPVILASMFGSTTKCVDRCRELLVAEGYEVLVFHATGIGGKVMESLVDEGYATAVLDITTTEWADELCGGVFSAGQDRLSAPGRVGVPHLIVPGCVDMANFGPADTVPERHKDRHLFVWNPNITLLRTNVEENKQMGEIFARKANEAKGPVAFLLPKQGVSILDQKDGEFWDPEADKAMFDSLKSGVRGGIAIEELDANINDNDFAEKAVAMMLELIGK